MITFKLMFMYFFKIPLDTICIVLSKMGENVENVRKWEKSAQVHVHVSLSVSVSPWDTDTDRDTWTWTWTWVDGHGQGHMDVNVDMGRSRCFPTFFHSTHFFQIYYIESNYCATFCPIRHFVPFDVLSHSTF